MNYYSHFTHEDMEAQTAGVIFSYYVENAGNEI